MQRADEVLHLVVRHPFEDVQLDRHSAVPQCDHDLLRWPEMSSVDWRVPLYVIHAREDEVLDLGPTEEIVTALRDRGVPIELHILEGVTHFETQHFASALHRALPWLERTWGRP